MIPAWTIVRRSVAILLLLATVLLPCHVSAQDGDLEWPFPEFTKQRSMKIKVEVDDAYLKMAIQYTRKYALAVVPLAEVKGTVADIEAMATSGEGLSHFETARTTDTRIYMTRGTVAAMWFADSLRAYPTEAVVELDRENSRLLVFYKIDLRGTFGATSQDWKNLLGEAMRWALAAEGK